METIGGKATSLIKLQKAGFQVPFFFALKPEECTKENLQKILQEKFSGIDLFAVRSSFIDEDGKNKSFAGHFYSALGIAKDNLEEECKKVIDSYNGGSGAVILQEFINSDSSGVIFSDAGDNKIVINSTIGLCESVVKGKRCDEYIINRDNKKISSRKIEGQKEILRFKNGCLLNGKEKNESLTDKQIEEIANKAIEIEKFFGTPQDIEFCFYKQKLFILQSRPITRSIFSGKEQIYYDSANIAESYSGIVLPLTYSFVELIYSEVYKDLLCASGVSREKVGKYDEIFDTLVCSFYGKLYYNMNSWYKMMTFLPGYKRNKNNLELMISSNSSLNIEQDIKPSILFSMLYFLRVTWKILVFPITVHKFKNSIKKSLSRYSNSPIEKMSLGECMNLFQELLSSPLKKWYVAVENDTALMTLLGKMYSKGENEFNSSRITSHSVSANQVTELKKLSDLLITDQNILLALRIKNEKAFFKNLSENEELKTVYNKYFTVYGGRFANELKLESDDLREDFSKFSSLVNIYSTSNFATQEPSNNTVKGFLNHLICFFATNREEMRLLRSNMFSIVRRIFLRMGDIFYRKGYIKDTKDIFYLSIDEIFTGDFVKKQDITRIIDDRKNKYLDYGSKILPPHFLLRKDEMPEFESSSETFKDQKILKGSVSSPGIISGKIRVFTEFNIPDKIDFEILVARHTDPGWVPLIGLSKGLIIEHGGILSHASIVSRELGIPAVVGVNQATKILKTGDFVELNATLGIITIKE